MRFAATSQEESVGCVSYRMIAGAMAVVLLAGMLALSVASPAIADTHSVNVTARWTWADGEEMTIELRNYYGRPSYVVSTVDAGGGSWHPEPYGPISRRGEFRKDGEASAVLIWGVGVDGQIGHFFIQGPVSYEREDGSKVSVGIRNFAYKPSYVPGTVDAGDGTWSVSPWLDDERVMTFSEEGKDDVKLIWSIASNGSLIYDFVEGDVPNAPTGPYLLDYPGFIWVGWGVPSSTTEITGYELVYREKDAAEWILWPEENYWPYDNWSYTADVTGLTPGTEYEFRVRALSAAGAGKWTETKSATPEEFVPPEPGLAPDLTALPLRLFVEWIAPYNNYSPITDFDVQYKSTDSETWLDITHDGTELSTTITSLSGGQSYDVRVRATNAGGAGEWSPSTTLSPLPEVPEAPTDVTTERIDQGITVSWEAPEDNGFEITGYELIATIWYPKDIADERGYEYDKVVTADGDATSATVSGLQNGKNYYIHLRAKNEKGWGVGVDVSSRAGLP